MRRRDSNTSLKFLREAVCSEYLNKLIVDWLTAALQVFPTCVSSHLCVLTSVCTNSLMCAFWSCLAESSDALIQEGGKFVTARWARLSSVLQLCFCCYWVQRYGRDRDGHLAFCGSCVSMCVIVFFYICMNPFPRVPDGQMTTDCSLVDLLCQTAELCREQRKGRRQIWGADCPQVCPDWKDAFS